MQGLGRTLKVLGNMPLKRATETLLEALDEPSPSIRNKVLDCLLGTKWNTAAPRLIAHYGRLDSRQRSRMLDRHEELVPHLRAILEHGKYDSKCNAIRIVSDVGKIRLMHLLIPVFSGIDERVRRRAGRALMSVVDSYMGLGAKFHNNDNATLATALARSRREIAGVFGELLRSYPYHREKIILRGLLKMGDNCHRLLMTVFQPGNERTAADLLKVLLDPEGEQWDIFLARMFLYHDALVKRRSDYILKKRGPACLGKVIRHIFTLASVRVILNVSKRWGEDLWWKAVRENMDDYEDHVKDKIIAVIRESGTKSEIARACLKRMSCSKSVHIRRKVVAEISSLKNIDASAFEAFLQDPDENVQLDTTRRLIESDHPQIEELVIRQLLSPHESVRKLASKKISHSSFRAYMRAFDALGDHTRSLAASALAKIDGELDDELSMALTSTQTATKLKALKIAALSHHEKKLEPLIIALAADADPYVRATAVMAVERMTSEKAEEVLINALKDNDDRVVANAIKALELKGNPKYLSLVKGFMDSPVPRIRGNAVKFLFRFGDPAYEELFLSMCESHDRRFHATAIWLAEVLEMPESAEGMLRIIHGKSDPKVRQRAVAAFKRIRARSKKQESGTT